MIREMTADDKSCLRNPQGSVYVKGQNFYDSLRRGLLSYILRNVHFYVRDVQLLRASPLYAYRLYTRCAHLFKKFPCNRCFFR